MYTREDDPVEETVNPRRSAQRVFRVQSEEARKTCKDDELQSTLFFNARAGEMHVQSKAALQAEMKDSTFRSEEVDGVV